MREPVTTTSSTPTPGPAGAAACCASARPGAIRHALATEVSKAARTNPLVAIFEFPKFPERRLCRANSPLRPAKGKLSCLRYVGNKKWSQLGGAEPLLHGR